MARTLHCLPDIPEEDDFPPYLHRVPRCQVLVERPSNEQLNDYDSKPQMSQLNLNMNRRPEHSMSDSGSDTNDFEKIAPESDGGGEGMVQSAVENELANPSKTDDIDPRPSWDASLNLLKTSSAERILRLADVRAVMLSESRSIPYADALGHILMSWQLLRSGFFIKDCRTWLRKNDNSKPFKDPPFTSAYGVAGFCIRKNRKAPDTDDLSPAHQVQRLRNHLIEYTGFLGPDETDEAIRRINSKKDEMTVKYKGKRWEELEPVTVRWDNTGFHRSGAVQTGKRERRVLADVEPNTQLKRHSSLPGKCFDPEDGTGCNGITGCISPPNKKLRRHSSESALHTAPVMGEKSSGDDATTAASGGSTSMFQKSSGEAVVKENVRVWTSAEWNNVTSNNLNNDTRGVVDEVTGDAEETKEEHRLLEVSPCASIASVTDWSGSASELARIQQLSDSEDEQCNCKRCERGNSRPAGEEDQSSLSLSSFQRVEITSDLEGEEETSDQQQQTTLCSKEQVAASGLVKLRDEMQDVLKLSEQKQNTNSDLYVNGIAAELTLCDSEEMFVDCRVELDESETDSADEECNELMSKGSMGFQPSTDDVWLKR